MLNNVMNNALSGINAAQGGLSVISNNLANAGVGYYHRQSAVFGENPGTMSAVSSMSSSTCSITTRVPAAATTKRL